MCAMGEETQVDAYKRLTLDLLGGSGQWMSYQEIYWEHHEADGDVDEPALRTALEQLADGGAVQRMGDHPSVQYRIARPQEGESLADKVKRLEAEVERLTKERDDALADVREARTAVAEMDAENKRLHRIIDGDTQEIAALMDRLSDVAPAEAAVAERSVRLAREGAGYLVSFESTPDCFIVIHRGANEHDADVVADGVRNILGHILADHVTQIRAAQAADRAAVMALVDALPRCEARGKCGAVATVGIWDSPRGVESDGYLCDQHMVDGAEDVEYAAPLRALLERMATWEVATESRGAADRPTLSLDALEQAQIRAALVTLREQRDGAAARFARKALGQTRDELGVAFGYTDEAVERWEDGSDNVPAAVVRDLLGNLALKCGVEYAPSSVPRHIGEFCDIDEPSVGDVDGYGRRK